MLKEKPELSQLFKCFERVHCFLDNERRNKRIQGGNVVQQIIHADRYSYRVGKQVGIMKNSRLYHCEKQEDGEDCLLIIAAEATYNSILDRAAYVLDLLRQKADEYEESYARVKTDPDSFVNYGISFPELVESFVCEEQGGRRINTVCFREVKRVNQLFPLRNITVKDQKRVDLRTSAWILGKALKLLVFIHSLGITNGAVNNSNILIEPLQHYVVFFSWDDAITHTGDISKALQRDEITKAAQTVIALLGGDYERFSFPPDITSDETRPYTDYLLSLAHGRCSIAQEAHAEFYRIVDSLWGKVFHPFTTIDL